MITKKQYDAAKKVVIEYERQNRRQPPKNFTLDDLDIRICSIGVPCLTESVVDENFARMLSDRVEQQGASVDFVSLDDFGYISISFRALGMKDLHISAVLNALNRK